MRLAGCPSMLKHNRHSLPSLDHLDSAGLTLGDHMKEPLDDERSGSWSRGASVLAARWMVVGFVVGLSPGTAHALGVAFEGGAGMSHLFDGSPQAIGHAGVGLLFGGRDNLEVHLGGSYPPWAAPIVVGTFRGHLRFGSAASGPWFNLGLGGGAGLGIEGPSVALLVEASPAFEVRVAPHTRLLVGATLTTGPLFSPWPQDVARFSWSYTWSLNAFVAVAFGSNLH